MMGVAITGTGVKRFFSFFIPLHFLIPTNLILFHIYLGVHQNYGFHLVIVFAELPDE